MKTCITIFFVSILTFFSPNVFAQQENFEEKIATVLKEHGVPGAAIAVVKKDSMLWNGYFGKANLVKDEPVTKNTLFGLGSISKTFLALGVMLAQENHQLNINTPLKQIIPTFLFTNEYESSNPLKLINLLEHTSGFDEVHFDIFAKANSQTSFDEVIKKSQSALTVRWRPGEYYSYNTLNYIVVADVLEKIANVPFEKFMQNRIFGPLEMDRATYFPADKPNMATGYSDSNVEPFPNIPQWPAGSLSTTLEEMERFTQLFLNNGRFQNSQVVRASSIASMENPESSLLARQGVSFSYGKGLMQEFVGQHIFYGHNGSYGGFLSEFGYSREVGVGYVILINNRNASAAIKEIKKLLLKPFGNEATNATNQQTINETFSEDLSEIEGAYQPVTANLEVLYPFMRLADLQFIEMEDEKWMQKSIFGDAQGLVRTGENTFKLKNEPKASTAFKVNQTETLWLGETSYRKISVFTARFQFYAAVICLLVFVFSFFSLFFSIIRRWVFKRKVARLQYAAFFSTLMLVLMGGSIALSFDPMKLYSLGALLFYFSGWLFLILSFFAFSYYLKYFFNKKKVQKWLLIQTGLSTIVCVIISSYLFYWDIIGLALWNY